MENKELKEPSKELDISIVDFISGIATGIAPLAMLNNLNRVFKQIDDEELIRNLNAFFVHRDKTSDEQRQKFKQKMADDYEEFMKRILRTIHKIESEKKAAIIGKLFIALHEERIEPTAFTKLMSCVLRIDYDALEYFLNRDDVESAVWSDEGFEMECLNQLMGAGLAIPAYAPNKGGKIQSTLDEIELTINTRFIFNDYAKWLYESASHKFKWPKGY